mmetsp:Transcript_18108/g.42009  ORF Transcript_18108/g.42009 Transcript_18108/m.42009 type:complete len:84 (-) Transcript_18108:16-267(-)
MARASTRRHGSHIASHDKEHILPWSPMDATTHGTSTRNTCQEPSTILLRKQRVDFDHKKLWTAKLGKQRRATQTGSTTTTTTW